MGMKFSVRKDGRLPAYVKKHMLDTWLVQKKTLDTDPKFQDWLYEIDWPEFILHPEAHLSEEETPGAPHHGIDRDLKKPVRIDIPTLRVKRENLIDLMSFLKSHQDFQYNFLLSLSAADFLGSDFPDDAVKNQGKRFEMIYMLRALHPGVEKFRGVTIRILMPVDEDEPVPSLTPLWVGANWPEREVYDMFGLTFENHPDLRRIIMPANYRGHPLRKDFPISGIGEDYLIDDLLTDRLLHD